MLKEYYDRLQQYNETAITEYLKVATAMEREYPEVPSEQSIKDIGDFQNILINLGQTLENEYALFDSVYITCLEKCCESIYQYTIGGGKNHLSDVVNSLYALYDGIKKDISLTDYHTSIILIAKNEDRYIKEWIEFHKLVGIDHFYVYDNDSESSFKKILDPYIEDGLITYISFPGKLKQMEAYNHALKYYKYETKYMAFIDADEFLVPVTLRTVPEEIDYIIDHYKNRKFRVDWEPGGIAVNWRWYGSSYHRERQPGLLTENYTMRADDDYDQNAHVKTICNPRVAVAFEGHPHSCTYLKGYFNISEMGSYVPGAFFYDCGCKHLRLNHYHMKSEEEFIEKWHRGWPDRVRTFEDDEQLRNDFRKEEKECNAVKDDIMEKYVEVLKDHIR